MTYFKWIFNSLIHHDETAMVCRELHVYTRPWFGRMHFLCTNKVNYTCWSFITVIQISFSLQSKLTFGFRGCYFDLLVYVSRRCGGRRLCGWLLWPSLLCGPTLQPWPLSWRLLIFGFQFWPDDTKTSTVYQLQMSMSIISKWQSFKSLSIRFF